MRFIRHPASLSLFLYPWVTNKHSYKDFDMFEAQLYFSSIVEKPFFISFLFSLLILFYWNSIYRTLFLRRTQLSKIFRFWYTVLLTVAKVFAFVGKFGISGSFAVVINFTTELYPTSIRSEPLKLSVFQAGIFSRETILTNQVFMDFRFLLTFSKSPMSANSC